MDLYNLCLVLLAVCLVVVTFPTEGSDCGDPNDWKELNARYYYLSKSKSPSRAEAKNECAKKGAMLATSNSEEINNFLIELLKQNDIYGAWIGLHFRDGETLPSDESVAERRQRNRWEWDMNPAADYTQDTFDDWTGSQPKHYGCVRILGIPSISVPYNWVATSCSFEEHYICERVSPCDTCPLGFEYFDNKCYLYEATEQPRSKADAANFCEQYGAFLLTILSPEENDYVKGAIYRGSDPWLDLSKAPGHKCEASSSNHTCFKEWSWKDGNPFTWDNFNRNILDDSKYREMFVKYEAAADMTLCASYGTVDSRWYPRECDEEGYIMCKWVPGVNLRGPCSPGIPCAQALSSSATPTVAAAVSSIAVFTFTTLLTWSTQDTTVI